MKKIVMLLLFAASLCVIGCSDKGTKSTSPSPTPMPNPTAPGGPK